MIMSFITYRSCLLLIFSSSCVLSSADYDHRYDNVDSDGPEKQRPRPYDSILSKFDVHHDSIILTSESRSMGAKFINETETASNEECLMWCWKHRDCNVAVFEEVVRRSCFIFNCGPPADFRCKFTTHNFYSSSFLKMSQHLYDLKEWGKEAAEQEREAKKALSQTVTSTTVLATTTAAAALNSPSPAVSTASFSQIKGIVEGPKCRHYQFQCLNSSECIAIYNVCDGIPQCPDGSDESAELRCPLKGAPKLVPSQKTLEPIEHTVQILPVNTPSVQGGPSSAQPQQQQQQKQPETQQTVHVTQILTPVPPPQARAKPIIVPTSNKQHQAHQHHIASEPEQALHGAVDEAAMYREGYKGPKSQQGLYFDTSPEDSLRSPFSHRHSKFMAANDPRLQYPSRWPDDYERYQMKASIPDQHYGGYDNGYQRVSDTFPKSQYPDYDRTVYDTYHPEDSPVYSEQDQLPSSSYISSNDYPQPNLPSIGQQASYSSREEPYEGQRMQQKPIRNEEYIPINRPVIKQVHKLHGVHQPKPIITDQDSYMPSPEDLRSQPYIQYGDMPRTNYRIMSEIKAPDISIPNSRIAADMSHMYERDEAIRKSLSQQLQALHNEPMHMSDHLLISSGHTPIPVMVKPKGNMHLVQAPGHESNSQPKLNAESMDHHPELKLHHKPLHNNVSPQTAADGISAKKLSAGTKSSQHVKVTHAPEGNNTVIVVAMGLIITTIFIILVGCRLRTLRRKTIRRGRNLTHDADYLVNGLYL